MIKVSNMITFDEVTKFILANRSGYVFKGWPVEHIRIYVADCLRSLSGKSFYIQLEEP